MNRKQKLVIISATVYRLRALKDKIVIVRVFIIMTSMKINTSDAILSALHIIILIFTAILRCGCYYHFTDEKIKMERDQINHIAS